MDQESIRILVASDNATAAWLIAQTVSDEGFIVDTAADEAQALRLLGEDGYDLVVLDLAQSEGGTSSIIDRLAPERAIPPLVILSEPGAEKAVVDLLKTHFGDYVTKDREGKYIEILPFIIDKTLDRHSLFKEKEETEQELSRVTHEKLAILNSMSEMVLFLDPDLNVVWANNTITQTIGTTQAELSGRQCHDILMNSETPCEGCPIIVIRDKKIPQSAEITTPDGRVWSISGYPMFDDSGEIEGIVEMKVEITERKRWEAKLTRASDEWRSTFDSIADVVAINDTGFGLIKVNKAFADVFDLSPKDLVGRTCHELFYGTVEPCPECPQKKGMSDPRHAPIEYTERRFGDHVRISASPIVSEEGEVIGFVTIGKDITAQIQWEKKLKRASDEWRTTFDSIVDPISIIGEGFGLVKVNRAFAAMLESEPKRLIGKTCYQVLHDAAEPCAHCPQPIAGETKATAITSYQDERQKRHIQITCSPILDERGEAVGFVNVKTDITEQKKEEASLKKESGHLKKMVGQLSKELKDAQAVAIEQSQVKAQKQFAGRVGLEMKRTLDAIAKVLQKEKGAPQDLLRNKTIMGRLRGLDRMTGNLLFYSQERRPKREEIVVSELVTRVLERDIPADTINLTLNIPFDIPYVFVDPQQIERAVDNLIVNSVEAMPDGGDLIIKAEKDGSGVRISIADTGPGIPVKDTKRLFTPLFTTKPSAIGIGLSIAKDLIEANGGRLTVDNNESKGCTFSVFLPTTEATLKKDGVDELFK
jgi:two-component system NtrC family sensor kinase